MELIGMMTRTEPMQDVDAMWEADAAAEWERINADDPEEEKLKDAAYDIHQAWYKLCDVLDEIATAIDKVEGTCAEDKITSLINDIEDIQEEVMGMYKKLERGEC